MRNDVGRVEKAHRPRCRRSGAYVHDIEPDASGKRRQATKSGFRTPKEAEQALAAAFEQTRAGVQPNVRLTVGEYLEQWLDGRVALRPSTRRSYEGHLRLHLIPGIGRVLLDDLRPAHVDRAFQKLRANPELECRERSSGSTPRSTAR